MSKDYENIKYTSQMEENIFPGFSFQGAIKIICW
jgi:hypothetical protein